jgi:hypothetical protein
MARCGEAGALLSPFATGSVPMQNRTLDRHLAHSKEKMGSSVYFRRRKALILT